MKALRSFTVRPASRRSWRALEDAGHEPAVVVGRADPRPVPLGRPRAWDASVHDPVRLLGARAPRAARRARRPTPASCASSARCTTSSQRYLDEPRWFQAREATSPLRVGRLLLARVRHRRGAAAVLRRPRRARRRPPQGGQRPRRAARRHRPLLPPRLLPPGADRRRLAAGALPRPRPATRWRSRRCDGVRVERRPRRRSRSSPRCGGPRSAACRSTCSTPTSTRTPPSCATVTDRLYGGDTEHRLRQEILLGIGGVRALEALGIDAQVFHTNEGHAGFLGLERIRQLHRRATA